MHEEKIVQMIPALTWEGLIRDIVKKESLDPWDIDIDELTTKFFENIEDSDIVTYGKLFLTASLLLRMKSDMIEDEYQYYLSDLVGAIDLKDVFEVPDVKIYPKLNPPRKRKVTVDDLVNALKKAMEVEKRRDVRHKDKGKSLKIREMFKSIDRGVTVIANGPLRDTNDMLKYMALGANLIGIDDITRSFLRAYLSFRTGEGDIDDQDLIDRDGELDWAEIGEMFGEFIRYLAVDMEERHSFLNIDPHKGIQIDDIDTSDYNTASITGLTLQGFGAPVPIWRHRS